MNQGDDTGVLCVDPCWRVASIMPESKREKWSSMKYKTLNKTYVEQMMMNIIWIQIKIVFFFLMKFLYDK